MRRSVRLNIGDSRTVPTRAGIRPYPNLRAYIPRTLSPLVRAPFAGRKGLGTLRGRSKSAPFAQRKGREHSERGMHGEDGRGGRKQPGRGSIW